MPFNDAETAARQVGTHFNGAHGAHGNGIMFSLNNRGIEEKSSRPQDMTGVGTAGRTAYDPTLIKHLKSDHAALRDLLGRLGDHARHRQFAKVPGTLARLRDALMRHIEEENEHFYAYVFQCAVDGPEAREQLERTCAKMAGIARLALLFTRHYTEIGVTSLNRDAFARDLEVIDALLTERIELEETSLYALYLPPNRAADRARRQNDGSSLCVA